MEATTPLRRSTRERTSSRPIVPLKQAKDTRPSSKNGLQSKRRSCPSSSSSDAEEFTPRKPRQVRLGRPSKKLKTVEPLRATTDLPSSENDLFNTIITDKAAIEPTLDDWMDIYKGVGDDEEAKGHALSLFINFVLRCSGCNHSIDKYQAIDLDAATDTLDTIQEEFKQVASHAYPLIAKAGKSISKNFRKNLITLVVKFIKLAHANSTLYDDRLIPSIQSYLVSMSSSSLRSFRHTATYISLFGFMSTFCALLAEVSKELITLNRKVEVETAKHRKESRHGKADHISEWQKRKKHVRSQKLLLESYISDFFDGVFVHRYRDADPAIRVDCVQALGQWMRVVPECFLEGNYLRYIGWVVTDSNKDARNEALKALNALYAKDEHIGAMKHFTLRFRSQLLEMATGETDLVSRCLSINILTSIDKHGLLESGDRNSLGRLIYHEDSRVRRTIGPFFNNLLEEEIDARKLRMNATLDLSERGYNRAKKVANKTNDDSQGFIGFKCLAKLLHKLGKEPQVEHSIRNSKEDDQSADDHDTDLDDARSVGRLGDRDITMGTSYRPYPEKGRVALAVEDLWKQVDLLRNWKTLCRFLLLDHTASFTPKKLPPTTSSRTQKPRNEGFDIGAVSEGNSNSPEIEGTLEVDDACKLNESEETILVEILVASLRLFGASYTSEERSLLKKRKKNISRNTQPGVTDDEIEQSEDEGARVNDQPLVEDSSNTLEMTRIMVNVLPKLWSKYYTDPVRSAEVFRIPKIMSLDLYLDLRMVPAFEDMWETLIKQYLTQQHPEAIYVISTTIEHILTAVKSLDHINQQKIQKLNHALIGGLKDFLADKTDVETITLEGDEIVTLSLFLNKTASLVRQRDMSSILQSDGTADLPSPLSLITGIAHRGRLAIQNEAGLVEVAFEIMQLNFMWSVAKICHHALTRGALGHDGVAAQKEITDKNIQLEISRATKLRTVLVDLLSGYCIGAFTHACGSVKRAAFVHLLNTYLLCQGAVLPEKLRLVCDEQTQFRCSGFVQAEIEKFVDQNVEREDGSYGNGGQVSDTEDDARPRERRGVRKPKIASLRNRPQVLPGTQQLHNFEEFDLLITTFAKAIRCGLLHLQHSSAILPHFARISKVYDFSVELVIVSLNDGFVQSPQDVDLIIKCLQDALIESLELYLNDKVPTDEQFMQLSRLFQSVIVIRGARMSFNPRLDSASYIKLHMGCIKWLIDKAVKSQEDPSLTGKMSVLFKGLALLIQGMDGQAALKIQTEVGRLVESCNLTISPNVMEWDAYRHYSKRLLTIMDKDSSVKEAAKKLLQRHKDMVSGRQAQAILTEPDDNQASADPDEADSVKAVSKVRPKTKPKTKGKDARSAVAANSVTRKGRASNSTKASTIAQIKDSTHLSDRQSPTPASRSSSVLPNSRTESLSVVIPPGPSQLKRSLSRAEGARPQRQPSADAEASLGDRFARKRPRIDAMSDNMKTSLGRTSDSFAEENPSRQTRSDSNESEVSLSALKRQSRKKRK